MRLCSSTVLLCRPFYLEPCFFECQERFEKIYVACRTYLDIARVPSKPLCGKKFPMSAENSGRCDTMTKKSGQRSLSSAWQGQARGFLVEYGCWKRSGKRGPTLRTLRMPLPKYHYIKVRGLKLGNRVSTVETQINTVTVII